MLLRGSLLLCLATLPTLCAPLETEIVTPICLDPDLSGRQYSKRGPVDPPQHRLIYQITAFHEDFYLNLSPDAQFITPHFATQYQGPLAGRGEEGAPRHCFYFGDINSNWDSFAALSLCVGLTGAFGYRGAESFISPFQNNSGNQALWSSQGKHLLQRRSAPGPAGSPTSRCGMGSSLNPAILQALEKYKVLQQQQQAAGSWRPGNETGAQLAKKGDHAKHFISIPRYVETLVVADESMVNFHGDDLQHYLLLRRSRKTSYRPPPTSLGALGSGLAATAL